MRFWIVGGGTGGHVYPALAVARALQAAKPKAEITWVGTPQGMEAQLIERAELPYLAVPAGGVHGVRGIRAVVNAWRLTRGLLVALRYVRKQKPDAMLTTGGYLSVPVAIAAWLGGVPILLFVPDIEPARSVKFVARLATRIGVTVEDSKAFLPEDKMVVSGYPLRQSFSSWTRASAREVLDLHEEIPVLLVFGGSRGARSINRALLAHVAELTDKTQIIHISGELDWSEVSSARQKLPESVKARYHAFAYMHEMGAAFAAADLVLCRAGAGVLGELPYFGLPAILVPYPYAWRYQRVNANWLADRGAALVLDDADLAASIVPTVRSLLVDVPRRHAMSEAARALARPKAAQRLAKHLIALAGAGQEKSGIPGEGGDNGTD